MKLTSYLRLTLFICGIIVYGCHRNHHTTILLNEKERIVENPPGGIEVESNLFIDEAEVTNQYWRDMLYWFGFRYSKTSVEYLSMLPVQEIDIHPYDSTYQYQTEYYYGRPEFTDYPIVGVDHNQAMRYCKWRSERVFEIILTRDKYIEPFLLEDSTNYFTVKDYFEQSYKNSIVFDSTLLVPLYSLPKVDLMNYLIAEVDSSHFTQAEKHYMKLEKKQKRWKKRFGFPKVFIGCQPSFCDVYHGHSNTYDLFHSNSNASELCVEDGCVYGGNVNDTIPFVGTTRDDLLVPGPLVGFRCVCKWVTYKEYKKFWESIQ